MTERVFPVLPKVKQTLIIGLILRCAGVAVAVWIALDSGVWIWWALAGIAAGLAIFTLLSLTQRKYVAKVDDKGVTVQLSAGREMHAPWATIEAHTIDPTRRIGAVLKRAEGGRVSVLPVSVRAMGPEAAEELIAAMKERLPKLEYRVPSMGGRKKR